MAYQSLNIVGSFTAGATAVQREISADRDRTDTYRTLLRSQLQGTRATTQDVADVDSRDRMQVGDAPEESRRNPYLYLRYPAAERRANPETDAAGPAADSLDIIV